MFNVSLYSVFCFILNSNVFFKELKVKATWDLIQMLKGAESLTAQNQILKLLLHREGPNYHFEGMSVSRRLEQLVARAGLHKRWEVVRCCSALLGKLVDSLAPSITSILVRGKHVSYSLIHLVCSTACFLCLFLG